MNRDDEAWVEALYETNASRMHRIAARRLGDEEAAKDLVQEAFLALVSKIDAVKDHPNPGGWLMKALRYLMLQQIECAQRQMDHELPLEEAAHAAAPAGALLPLREQLPHELTPGEKDLLVWHYEERISYEEIAARLHIPLLTCRTRMFRARRRYQKLAEKEEIFFERME